MVDLTSMKKSMGSQNVEFIAWTSHIVTKAEFPLSLGLFFECIINLIY